MNKQVMYLALAVGVAYAVGIFSPRKVKSNPRLRRLKRGKGSLAVQKRAEKIEELFLKGVPVGEIAKRLHVSRISIGYHLKKIRSKISDETLTRKKRLIYK